MSACEPWCPVVKAKLRKVVAESPWICERALGSREVRKAAPSVKSEDEKFASLDYQRDDEKHREKDDARDRRYRDDRDSERATVTEKWLDVKQEKLDGTPMVERKILLNGEEAGTARRLSDIDGKTKVTAATQSGMAVSSRTVTERDVGSSLPIVSTKETETARRPYDVDAKTKATAVTQSGMEVSSRTAMEKDVGSSLAIASVKEAGTAPGLSDVGSDKLVETDMIERTAKYAGDSSDKIAERERMETPSKMGKRAHEPIGEQDVSGERSDIADPRDECDPSCSRRVLRKSKRRKLEERQKLVDAYLLNKGARYFDDVCTCSLSCILYAMKNDSFVTSILTSVALFTLGLKLCSELDAWYLPTRLS